jgi:hypothetical protein
MQKLVCDACGRGEDSTTPQKKLKIRKSKLGIVNDRRTTVPEGTDRYEADHCPECRGAMLAKYFRVYVEGLEMPTSVSEPTERERQVRIAT